MEMKTAMHRLPTTVPPSQKYHHPNTALSLVKLDAIYQTFNPQENSLKVAQVLWENRRLGA